MCSARSLRKWLSSLEQWIVDRCSGCCVRQGMWKTEGESHVLSLDCGWQPNTTECSPVELVGPCDVAVITSQCIFSEALRSGLLRTPAKPSATSPYAQLISLQPRRSC